MPYPEHEKMAAVAEQSQAQGEFLDWCLQKGYVEGSGMGRIDRLLAEFHGIDLTVIEREKKSMLEAIEQEQIMLDQARRS